MLVGLKGINYEHGSHQVQSYLPTPLPESSAAPSRANKHWLGPVPGRRKIKEVVTGMPNTQVADQTDLLDLPITWGLYHEMSHYALSKYLRRHTYSLEHHIHSYCQVNKFDTFIECVCHSGNGGKIHGGRQRTVS
jgi:hypothetical protein